jgi:hypothetical protein
MDAKAGPDDDQQAHQTVAALMKAAGLNPPADELERLAGLYPGLRAAADRFHRCDVGDEVPAAVFRAGWPEGAES